MLFLHGGAVTKFILLAALVMSGRKDVTAGIMQIHDDCFLKHLGFEEAVLVRPDGVEVVSGTRFEIKFTFTNDIIAVIHTHVDAGFELPSAPDFTFAVTHHVPVYIVSKSQIWRVTENGRVEQVK